MYILLLVCLFVCIPKTLIKVEPIVGPDMTPRKVDGWSKFKRKNVEQRKGLNRRWAQNAFESLKKS